MSTDDTNGSNDGGDAGTLPRVVLLVRPREAVAAAVSPQDKQRKERQNAATVKLGGDRLDAVRAVAAKQAAEPKPAKPRKPWSPADDRLIAAVIQVDLAANPSPLTDFLGTSLLYRAAYAARAAGAPRLVLVVAGDIDDDGRRDLHRHAQAGFGAAPIEVVAEDPDEVRFGRGRILVMDGAALHDPAGVATMARVEGAVTAILLGPGGDGVRVQTSGGKVLEFGDQIAPYDGVMVGVCSVPSDDFVRITQSGMPSAMRALLAEERLVVKKSSTTYARQFAGEDYLAAARKRTYDALASTGSDGFFDELISRPLARRITLKLLHNAAVTPTFVSVLAGVLAVLGAALLASGYVASAILAGLLLVLSAVLDRTDGELARLRLDDAARPLDFFLDHASHALVVLGLAMGVRNSAPGTATWSDTLERLRWLPEHVHGYLVAQVGPIPLGLLAAGGVVFMFLVLWMRGAPDPHSRGVRRVADFLAASFGSRDYFYLLLAAVLLHAFMPSVGLLGLFLLLSAVLIHPFWLTIGLLSLAAPRPQARV